MLVLDSNSEYNGIMKTTIDIPRPQLEEAMLHTGARTKRDAVVTAITEFNRRKRLARLAEHFGTFEHFMTNEELTRLREEG